MCFIVTNEDKVFGINIPRCLMTTSYNKETSESGK